jgi:hypothetical protein
VDSEIADVGYVLLNLLRSECLRAYIARPVLQRMAMAQFMGQKEKSDATAEIVN